MKINRKTRKEIFKYEEHGIAICLVAFVIFIVITIDSLFGLSKLLKIDLFNFDKSDSIIIKHNNTEYSMSEFYKINYSGISDSKYGGVDNLLKSTSPHTITITGEGIITEISKINNNYSVTLDYGWGNKWSGISEVIVRFPVKPKNMSVGNLKNGDTICFKGDFHLVQVENENKVLYVSFANIVGGGEK